MIFGSGGINTGPAMGYLQQAFDLYDDRYNQSRDDFTPYLNLGADSVGMLSQLLGLTPGMSTADALALDPGYQFRLEEGQKALDRRNAAGGNFLSGQGIKDAIRFNQGTASQEYGNLFNRLMGVSGQGLNAASGIGNLGANYAQMQGNTLGNLANLSLASQYAGGGGGLGSALGLAGQLGSLFGGGGGLGGLFGGGASSFFRGGGL